MVRSEENKGKDRLGCSQLLLLLPVEEWPLKHAGDGFTKMRIKGILRIVSKNNL